MRFTTNGLFDDGPDTLRSRIVGIYCLLFLFNAGSWIWAVMAFAGHPALLGTAFLAYSLGLRHAVDADHIAAIDNVTRKLMHAGKRPVGVGFLFSLGHSTIVLAGAAAIAGMALTLQNRIAAIRAVGSGRHSGIDCVSVRDRNGQPSRSPVDLSRLRKGAFWCLLSGPGL